MPDSATMRTNSKTTPTDSDTAVKAATPNSSGAISSEASQRSSNGIRDHWRRSRSGRRCRLSLQA